jgi:hypothetical protein
VRRATLLVTGAVALTLAGRGEVLAAEGWLPFGLRGKVVLKNFSYFAEAPTDHRRFRDEGVFQLEWTRRFAPWIRVRVVGDAREDDAGLTRGVSFRIADTARRRSVVNLTEAFAELGGGPVQLAVGKQVYAWGTADAYNPTDNINPYDYLDPIDHEKLGVYAAALHASGGPTSLTLVVIPAFTPSRVPLPSSRWAPAWPAGPVVVEDRQLPPARLDEVQFAARARVTVRGWDVAVSYFDGFDDTPVIRRSSLEVAPLVVMPRLTPVFTRFRAPGLDFSTTYRSFEFHGELAAKLVETSGAEDRLQGIFGLNYTWDAPVRGLEQITGGIEYAREESLAVVDPEVLRVRDALWAALPNDAFRNAVVGRVEVKFGEDTQLKLRGTADLTRTPSHYMQARVFHKLSDPLQLEAGFEVFGGRRETFWGRWDRNDRFFALLRYLF